MMHTDQFSAQCELAKTVKECLAKGIRIDRETIETLADAVLLFARELNTPGVCLVCGERPSADFVPVNVKPVWVHGRCAHKLRK